MLERKAHGKSAAGQRSAGGRRLALFSLRGRHRSKMIAAVLTVLAPAILAACYEQNVRSRAAALRATSGWTRQEANAYEHALASAELASVFSEGIAETIGTFRERLQWLNVFNPGRPAAIYKDLYNNAVGRRIGVYAKRAGLSAEMRRRLLIRALGDGSLIVASGDPRIPAGFDGNPDGFDAKRAWWDGD